MAAVIQLACALALTLAAEAPFVELSFDAALAKARESEKVVFVDFFTTWCGPCKKLDATTWKDERVRAWLGEHTVPLKIDAEQEAELARRYEVRAYPTLLFVNPDGSVKDRLVGYVEAEEFLSLAEGVLAGITEAERARAVLDRARAAFEGHENDPMARGTYAGALVQAGLHAEALEHYLWCFDEGEEHRPAYGGVRLSFLLADIAGLGRAYPPALEALRGRRDEREQRLLADGADARTAREYVALNRDLGENRRTLQVLDQLVAQGRGQSESAALLAEQVSELLLDDKRYRDLHDLAGMSTPGFQDRMQRFEQLRQIDPDPDSIGIFKHQLVSKGGISYEVLLALDKPDEAAQVLSACLEVDPGRSTYRRFVQHALAASRPEPAHALAQRALAELQDKDRDWFRRWWERTNEAK